MSDITDFSYATKPQIFNAFDPKGLIDPELYKTNDIRINKKFHTEVPVIQHIRFTVACDTFPQLFKEDAEYLLTMLSQFCTIRKFFPENTTHIRIRDLEYYSYELVVAFDTEKGLELADKFAEDPLFVKLISTIPGLSLFPCPASKPYAFRLSLFKAFNN